MHKRTYNDLITALRELVVREATFRCLAFPFLLRRSQHEARVDRSRRFSQARPEPRKTSRLCVRSRCVCGAWSGGVSAYKEGAAFVWVWLPPGPPTINSLAPTLLEPSATTGSPQLRDPQQRGTAAPLRRITSGGSRHLFLSLSSLHIPPSSSFGL